ncbi:MAG: hypothetical protein SPI91_01125 [Bacilli bacterium]|nr:hypothetical protein [Bacilli bacterium]
MRKAKFKFSEVNEETPEEKKEKKWEIIGVTVTLVVLVIAILYVWVIKPKKDLQAKDQQALLTPSIFFTDTINGDRVYINGKIVYFGNKDFYYVTKVYQNGKNTKTYPCVSINCKTCNPATYNFTQTKAPTYYEITTYQDNKCKNKSGTFKTKTYQKTNSSSESNTNKPTPALIITQPSKTTYEKETNVLIQVKHNQNKTMYYTFQNYNNGTKGYKQECTIFKANETKEFTLTVGNGNQKRYSEISLYSDSNCSNQVDMKRTNTFIYKPSKVYNNNGFIMIKSYNWEIIHNHFIAQKSGSTNCMDLALSYAVTMLRIGNGYSSNNLGSGPKDPYCRNYKSYGATENLLLNAKTDKKPRDTHDLYEKIIQEINAGRPSVVYINGSQGQHYVTIIGYRSGVNARTITWKDVMVLDPTGMRRLTLYEITSKGSFRKYNGKYRLFTWPANSNGKFCNGKF